MIECKRSSGKARERKRGDGRRPSRVGELIRHEISPIVEDAFADAFDLEDDKGTPVVLSVDDVRCSPDLRNVRVNISVMGNTEQKKQVLKWLKESRKSLRFELAQCIHMKYVPELIFGETETNAVANTVGIIERLRMEREEKATLGVDVAPAPLQTSIHDDLNVDAGEAIVDDDDDDDDNIGPSYLTRINDIDVPADDESEEGDGPLIVDIDEDDDDLSEMADDRVRQLLFQKLGEEDAKLN